jgi:hypothetical protein
MSTLKNWLMFVSMIPLLLGVIGIFCGHDERRKSK